mmetsp:Transcript_91147/g.253922  ORF Transcript_91147/g.253922 Transcript_91147/m.253922 type:complete len:362 (-) Transcript_91147:33-1118(-)
MHKTSATAFNKRSRRRCGLRGALRGLRHHRVLRRPCRFRHRALGLPILRRGALVHGLLVAEVPQALPLPRRWDGPGTQRLAHVREQALGLPVLLSLPHLRLLQQCPRLPALRLQLHDLPAIADALEEVLQAQLRLGSPVESLGVLRVLLQHGVASGPRFHKVLQLQAHRRLVELASHLQGLRLLLVLLLHAVDIAEGLNDLPVPLQGHAQTTRLQQARARLLPCRAPLQLLLLRHAPCVLRLLKVFQRQSHHHTLRLHLGHAQALLRRQGRRAHGDHGSLALLHLRHRVLQGVAHLPVPHQELQGLGCEAHDGGAAIRGRLHEQLDLRAVLRRVPTLALLDLLLPHRPILQDGHILRLEDL